MKEVSKELKEVSKELEARRYTTQKSLIILIIGGYINIYFEKQERMKSLLLLILILFLATNFALAADKQDYLDEFIFTELRVSAVTTDMYLYLGWFSDKKDWIKDASQRAIEDLAEIKDHVSGLNLPEELIELRQSNLNAINKLKEIYTGIENKKIENVKQEFIAFNEIYSQFEEKLKDALKKYRYIQELPEDFDWLNDEVKGSKNEKDKNSYLAAVELIKDKKYSEAYEGLNELRDKYKDSVFESCILLRMSDCLLKADSDLEVAEDVLEGKLNGLELLLAILDKKQYSPVLYEAFYKWRTVEQYYNHGMSNMSDIPNKDYNVKRWETTQLIKEYLKNEPDDIGAREQVDLLLLLPNITRGGPIGNHNLDHWGSLYVDLSKFKDKEPKE